MGRAYILGQLAFKGLKVRTDRSDPVAIEGVEE
jgi:hypothetical protein